MALLILPAASAAAAGKLVAERARQRGARLWAKLPAESRAVRIAQVGIPFQKTAEPVAGDGDLCPTIVTPTTATIAAGSGALADPSTGQQRHGHRGRPYISGLWANGRTTLGRLKRDFVTVAQPTTVAPPSPAPQGGAWYGKDVTFAGPASGAFHYLQPC